MPGSLARAVFLFGLYPRLGLIAARILVGHRHEEDPICRDMAASPLKPTMPLPGPPVLGFAACGAVVRRSALLEAGGFHPRLLLGGEERLLSIDLARASWGLSYVKDVIARHEPSPTRDRVERRRTTARNDLWTAWLRLPLGSALRETGLVAGRTIRDPAARRCLLDATRGLGWVVRQRSPVAPELNRSLRLLAARTEPQKTRR
jgi:GT2 family glycosyltransferase